MYANKLAFSEFKKIKTCIPSGANPGRSTVHTNYHKEAQMSCTGQKNLQSCRKCEGCIFWFIPEMCINNYSTTLTSTRDANQLNFIVK